MDLLFFAYIAITPLFVGFVAIFLLVTVFGAVFMIIYVKELVTQKKDQPLIAGSMFNQLIYFNSLFDYQAYLARKYRNYRLITPTHSEIYISDPVNVEYILKTNFSNYTKGEYNYGIMKDLFGDGIFAVDGEKWRHQRKLASYEFSTKVLRDFSSTVFRENAARLVGKISEVASSGKIDLQDFLMKSTLDSIFKVGFGIELNSLSGSDEFGNKFTKAFDDSNVSVYWRFVDPFWKIKRFLNIGSEAALKRNIKVMDDFLFQAIRCKREQMKSEKGDGKDTSANTLTWLFYMLCKHPFIQEKILHEVREATAVKENISVNEFAESITDEALDRMQYLHAALSETLRLYPAVPVDGKSSQEDDILPDGLKVKKGDGMNYMAYAMGRMTYIWGEDAEEFRPERWIQNGNFRPESYSKFTAFQAGPRICLGKEFAYRQMKILAATLLNFFKFRLVDQNKGSYISNNVHTSHESRTSSFCSS
ncbi:hypothetical protein IFM89_014032 [Coptis chinensis]|uniref:Cytochrome P450 n=1 Tax=Coptis chinensis TaxID=261450 RepID=A0A835IBZ3_9MAGN|nr:hypothetical protein IFM89_014032 [Coptis chinensis]